MQWKLVLNVALLGFVALSVAVWIGKTVRRRPTEAAPAAGSAGDKLIVYCFHSTARCPMCLAMEADAREALQEGLSDRLRDGRIELRVVDVEQPENEHFRDDYQLVGPAVVLVRLHDGRTASWENLSELAGLLGDKSRCVEHLRQHIRAASEK